MTTPKWQPGQLYLPGSLVVPRTPAAGGSTVITNPSFESGTADWTLGANTALDAGFGYGSSASIEFTGTGGETITEHAAYAVIPGKAITANCFYQQGAASAGQNGGACILRWYDSGMALLSDSVGNVVSSGSGGAWGSSSVSGVAPAGAAFVAIGVKVNRTAGASSWADAFSWNYVTTQAPAGLVYRAVQPAAGLSAASEPAWPPTVGVQVVDNEVTWEGALASRVTWEAEPILKSGPTEPTWPGTLGGTVPDNTISWETVARNVSEAPNSGIVLIAVSKVFAGDDDIIKYSATVNPLDWTTTDDAGYLPTGLQQYGANPVAAMGLYRANLVPFNAQAFQMWQIDEDPASMALLDAMPIGSQYHRAQAPVSGDLLFLSSQGVRSIGIAGGSTNLQAGDVGMPIDVLVQQALAAAEAAGVSPLAFYYPAAGQYWLVFSTYPIEVEDPPDGASEVFVYTMTRLGSVGAWSRYLFPYVIEDWAIKGDDLYVRSGKKIMRISDELLGDRMVAEDPPIPFVGTIQWPWLDFGQPGANKRMIGIDVVCDGALSVEIGYDQTNLTAFTTPYAIPADTLPGKIIPFPLSAPTFSLRLTFDGTERWHFRALNVYLNDNRMTS